MGLDHSRIHAGADGQDAHSTRHATFRSMGFGFAALLGGDVLVQPVGRALGQPPVVAEDQRAAVLLESAPQPAG